MGELKNTFKPEFLNRVDEIIVFHPLEEQHIKEIVKLMIDGLAKRIQANDIKLDVSDKALDLLASKGYDMVYGARPLRRAIQSQVEDKLAEEILEGRIKSGDNVLVDSDGENLTFTKKVMEKSPII
jgi:ATP-dependent Clp protease ATP-binding subunit ClpC